MNGFQVPDVDCAALQDVISYEEVVSSLGRLKNRKAAGFDGIPGEVLRNTACADALYIIYKHCFDTGTAPSDWEPIMVNPVPKSDMEDPRNPLSYRGISLLSIPSKVYADILNERLCKWLDEGGLLADEQNGFRKKRSCMEHIMSLFSIIDNRKKSKLDTFACFIDAKKAFDTIQS